MQTPLSIPLSHQRVYSGQLRNISLPPRHPAADRPRTAQQSRQLSSLWDPEGGRPRTPMLRHPSLNANGGSVAGGSVASSVYGGGGSVVASPCHSVVNMNVPPLQRARRLAAKISTLTVECWDGGIFLGSAGILTFFLLAFGLRHGVRALDPEQVSLEDRREKVKLHGVPMPTWPICYFRDWAMTEPVATARYFARMLQLYGNHMEADYEADRVAEVLHKWQQRLLSTFGDRSDGTQRRLATDIGISQYVTARQELLRWLELTLLKKETTFLLGKDMSWVDPLAFAVLFDDSMYMYFTACTRLKYLAAEATKLDDSAACSAGEAERQSWAQQLDLSLSFPRVFAFLCSVISACPFIEQWVADHRHQWMDTETDGINPAAGLEAAVWRAVESVAASAHQQQQLQPHHYGAAVWTAPSPTGSGVM